METAVSRRSPRSCLAPRACPCRRCPPDRRQTFESHKEPLMPSHFSVLSRARASATTVFCIVMLILAAPKVARGQAAAAKESAAAVKAAFLADIEAMRTKFVGLAEAFPADKYSWRPMDGVRSVSEVLMLIASEGYGFAPTAMGAKPAMSRE